MTDRREHNVNLQDLLKAGDDHSRGQTFNEIRSRLSEISNFLGKQTEGVEEIIELRKHQVQQQDKEWLTITIFVICIVGMLIGGMAYLAFLNDNLGKARQDLEFFSQHALHIFKQAQDKLSDLGFGGDDDFFKEEADQDEVDNIDATGPKSSNIDPF